MPSYPILAIILDNGNEARTNTNDQQLASTRVMETPALINNILRFVPLFCLVRCSAINRKWRESVESLPLTCDDFMEMKNTQSKPRPKQVNIHVLETAVFQYPVDYGHIHPNSGTCQFVLCRNGSRNTDSYGASNNFNGRTNSHQHRAHHEHDHGLQCDYRPSDIISNLYFKTDSPPAESSSVSGTPSQAVSNAESQLPEGGPNLNILISQLSSSSPQATDSSRTHNPKLRYVPCPYRPISDSSLDHENSPPPSRMNTETSCFGEHNRLSKSEDFEQQQSNRHHFGTSSDWSMSIQTYYDQRAATNAMILAARHYMESREAEECKIVQRTDTTRIIWNDTTKQELIWTITSTTMDRANPGDVVEHDYYPSRWEQEEQQL